MHTVILKKNININNSPVLFGIKKITHPCLLLLYFNLLKLCSSQHENYKGMMQELAVILEEDIDEKRKQSEAAAISGS